MVGLPVWARGAMQGTYESRGRNVKEAEVTHGHGLPGDYRITTNRDVR